MRRNALRSFFERIIMASLPLTITSCGDGAGAQDLGMIADLEAPLHADLHVPLPVDFAISDLLGDGSNVTPPSCETQYPPTAVMIPAGAFPDAGDGCVIGKLCVTYCPTGYSACCGPIASDGGAVVAVCYYNCPGGRRPAGLQIAQAENGCVVGRHFARMAHLEAASVGAFRILSRELSAHGAPVELVRFARRAARDEVRHARLMARIARAHGSTPARVEVSPSSTRSLEEMAIENATEGCVHETLGALIAWWQARTAQDSAIRSALAEIAQDETRHAELAWAVDTWANPQLSANARRRLIDARHVATAELTANISDPPAELMAAAGLPSAAVVHQFIAAANHEIWS